MSSQKSVVFLLCVLALRLWMPQANAQVPKIIFDTDLSSDHDDAADIAVVHALQDLGECELIACMASSQNGGTALALNSINTYYGRPNIPCGRRPDAGGPGAYPGVIASEYPHPLYATYTDPPLCVNLYRQVLAASPDASVIIVTAGYLNNLQALMQSGPDSYSPLNGMDLIRQKVKLWSCAGGNYPSGDEFNFKVEPTAAYYVVNNWPVAAFFDGYDIGQDIYSGGGLQSTPTTNPIRRAFELSFFGPYPTWTQIMIYYAVRPNERTLWNYNTIGRNNADITGHNWWTSTPDPTGALDQGYLIEIQRFPIQETLETLVMNSGWPASKGTTRAPNQPTHIRATVVGGNRIDLQWSDNSWNETGFTVERKISGVFTPIATVGTNVTTYSDTGLSTTANVAYRIKANNALGSSAYTIKTVFSGGWTETNLTNPSDQTPIYNYYQHDNLNWARGPNVVNHVTVNNDSNHGQDLTINVQLGAMGAYGRFYVYFFYQDQNNWYRVNTGSSGQGQSNYTSRFEKCIDGTITQIGSAGEGINMGNGALMQTWQVRVTPSGTLQFFTNNNATGNGFVGPDNIPIMHQVLNASDTFSFSSGKIALGSDIGQPVWGNFNFSTTGGGGGSAPAAPTGLGATAGNAQVSLSWTASSGATSYSVFRGTTSNGQSTTAVATGIAGTTYTDTGLSNGTTYYYKVKAVNVTGTSGYSNEASATPAGGSAPVITSSLTATGTVGSAFSYQITASNSPTSRNATGLPAGLSVNTSTGVISGTPTAAGTSNVTISATNASGRGSATLVLTVNSSGSAPVITSSLTATGTVGSAFSYQITASNSPTSRNATGLPAGLSVNTGTGVISGTPTAAGTSNVTISATNGSGTGSATLVLTVNASGGGGALTGAVIGTSGSYGGSSSTVDKVFDGNLTTHFDAPTASGAWAGLDLATTHVITQVAYCPRSGWASRMVGGVFQGSNAADFSGAVTLFTVASAPTEGVMTTQTVSNGTGFRYVRYLSPANGWCNIAEVVFYGTGGGGSAPVISSSLTATGTVGSAFSYQITASNSPTSRNATGLPAGLSVNTSTGVISGTPTAAGTSNVTISATNASGTGSATLVLTVNPSGGGAPVITSSLTATATVGSAFSYQITASNSPTSRNATGLPAGLSVNTGTGVISGTPSAAGTSNVTISATNGSGTGSATLVLTVNAAGGAGLTGTIIGTTGSYGGSQWTRDKVFDGSLATYFDADVASGAWAGLDLGTAKVITQVAYAPRSGWASRMVGGVFQGSNAADFSGAATLFTVASAPTEGTLTTQTVSNGTAFRYVRYLSAANGWCNVAEVVFYGSGGGGAPAAPTGLGAMAGNTQVSLSWTASSGATSYNVYRGTTSNGQSATAIATGVAGTTYTNTGLTNGTTYYYKVRAVNGSGTSGDSNEASATPSAGGSGASIGVQFVGSGTALGSTESAGLSSVAQTNWNALTGSSFSNQALVNNSGSSTSARLTGSAAAIYVGGGSSALPAGNSKLASGELVNSWPGAPTLTVSNIPYAQYDVYVYAAIDATGRNETVSVTPSGGAAQYFSFLTMGGGSAWTVATSTWNGTGTPPTLPSANYVRFSGLTASSFVMAWGAPGNGGLNGIQIVPVP